MFFLAFCSFIGMGKEPPFKTIASMMIGFALAAVGLDSVTGQLRLTFGFTELLNGFDFLIAVIGLFGIGEILLTMEEGLSFKGHAAGINPKVVLQTWKELPRYWVDVAALLPDRLLDGHLAGRRDARLVHELRHRQAHLEARRTISARARSRAWSRRRPPRTPPAPRRCCRCCRSACRARRPPRCCSAAC